MARGGIPGSWGLFPAPPWADELRGARRIDVIELAVLCRSYGVTVGEVLKATGRPFATGPNDPSLLPVRLALLAAFVAGVTYQVLTIRAARSTKTFLARLTAAYAHAA